MGPDHPLWSAALETIDRLSPSMKRRGDQTWPQWFSHLDLIGRDPLEATADDVDEFLSRFESRHARTQHRGILRDLYRAALDRGIVPEALIPDLVVGFDYRGAQRLDNTEVIRLVDSLSRDCLQSSHVLRARRDLVLVALSCSVECSTESLRGLTWGDLDLGGTEKTMRLGAGARAERVVLADMVCARIIDFRTELERHGVNVVPEDALLPALGHRVEWDWTLPERSLLAPLEQTSIHQAFKVMSRRASIGRSLESGKYFNHRWLLRSPSDLNRVLGGTHSTGKPKVAMRRVALDADPDRTIRPS